MMQQRLNGLKSRSDESRLQAAKDLQHYVSTELREASAEQYTSFMDELNHHIFEMVSSSDANEKKGGIMAIVALIGIDNGNTTKMSRFANYLRNLLPSNDQVVMQMASKAMGRLALTGGTFTADYVEFEVKRALEWLGGDRNEGRRHAAVLVLKELALNAPTFFFQQIQPFFENISNAVRDPKQAIREGAVEALQACLVILAQRETKEIQQRPIWYTQIYSEAKRGFEDTLNTKEKGVVLTKDDKAHGSLLIMNELIRSASIEGERAKQELEEIYCDQTQTQFSLDDLGINSPKSKFALQTGYQHQRSLALLGGGGMAETICHSKVCKDFMDDHFEEVCKLVLRYKTTRNSSIQQMLLTILPRLAAFQPKRFVKRYLRETMDYLSVALRRERERSSAFKAIGLIAIAVRQDVEKHRGPVFEQVKVLLPMKDLGHKRQKAVTVDPMVFACVAMMSRAIGPKISKEVKDLLEPMLSVGLSPALTACLHDLAHQVPQLKKSIQDGLLKMLSTILMNKPPRHPGAPRNATPTLTPSASSHSLFDTLDVTSTVLALRTLGTFDFDGHLLAHGNLVRHCADTFLASEHKDIRIEAVRTCSRLLSPSLHPMVVPHAPLHHANISASSTQVVSEVLSKMLMVGITDPDPDIRFCVLSSLDERFDAHLAQAENLSALFVALNDEEFEIREHAICTIGRLSSLNPAYIMPSLRKTLIQILTELEYSGVGRNKEQSARMLGHLVSNAPRLIRPYMEPILKALIPKLKDQDPNVVISVLAAIGEHAQVSGTEMSKWLNELCPIILDMLQDASLNNKREIALWTLGQLVESTGYVVEPYRKYPNLLEVLLNFLKTEQAIGIRREAIRVLGLLGALDPYKHKLNQTGGLLVGGNSAKDSTDNEAADTSTSEMLVTMGSIQLEEFYPAVAVSALMRIVRDSSLSSHHTMVIQAVTFIFKSLGMKCVTYLSQIMPSFLNVIRTCDSSFREFVLQQLGVLISIVKQHIRNYLDEIFGLIKQYWILNSPMQTTIILLVEQIVTALGGEFKIYLPQIIPQILKVFMHDNSSQRSVTTKLLNALQMFGSSLDDYLHLLVPPVVKLFDSSDIPLVVRRCALETLDRLSESLDLTDFASRIIHPIMRTLDSCPDLRHTAMDTLCSLVFQLGKQYSTFIPTVHKVIVRHRIQHQRYDILITKIVKSPFLLDWENEVLSRRQKAGRGNLADDSATNAAIEAASIKKLTFKADSLQRAWGASRCVSKDDWMEWLRRLSVELLKESPSPALRSCWATAQTYPPLARDLFNVAFVSCWSELHEELQNELVKHLEMALGSQIPEITQTLLNLAEFMEHTEKGALPLNNDLLGEQASKCRAYAKALHYKEEEFHRGPTTETLEALISINNKLQQPQAAHGVLVYAMKNHGADVKIKERWYEKLHDWEQALEAYNKKLIQNPDEINLSLGRMRCLEALGEWGELHQVAVEKWPVVSDDIRQQMARMAAAAAWGLGNWDSMEEYTCMIPRETQEGAFYRAALALHQNHFQQAQGCIDSARDVLDTELTARAGESYNRAYGAMVSVQMLSELEEIIQFKLVPERREAIKRTWWNRLQGCQRVVEDWQKILKVRSLVLSPQEDMKSWLKYSSLCRKSGRLALSHKTLVMLLGTDPSKQVDQPLPTTYPQVTFAYMKHMWRENKQDDAFKHLQYFVQNTLHQQALSSLSPTDDGQKREELLKLVARCYLKLGDWQTALEGYSEKSIPQILQYYAAATENDRNCYKAWHAWAYMNFETVLYYKSQQSGTDGPNNGNASKNPPPMSTSSVANPVITYAVPAVNGFFKSIALSSGNSLQDTLRLLTLWFDYGHWPEVYEALVEGIKTIQIDTWLQVIPQLIARIDTPRQLVGRLIHQLLTDIGKHHPQALIYPLTVASKSASSARHDAANQILNNMCEHSQQLVQQAVMVSDELIRVAILWHELWHEGLEEASRLYFSEGNVKGMFTALEPLHQMMERGPQTLKETSFNQAYGRDLMEAQEWCRKYQRSGNVKDLTQAWDLYYLVFRRISKQLPQLTSLELQYVSPKLLMCRDLELAVPGTYEPHKPVIHIRHVHASLNVITSKQRPRKLFITGSNGSEFMFLLKGHEDLRQDERVMQLFGLVNTLLAGDQETSKRHLGIVRYAVIPLSTNSGLIGWVPHSDTLHALIRDYREKKKILLNIEHRIMLRMAPDYDHLTLMQKVEVFEHALSNTNGDDLAKLLWLKSPSSEVWFDRRTNYTRSLAVMSMVGYVLGLGDRHPSNLMLNRLNGKIAHIDFGDCFEVAMTREKFPEKIPFRLTRMLTNAMEVTGIDGNYRMTCESVMRVLRAHKDSVMAVLEAFVYDPLLNWRLMDSTPKIKRSKGRSDTMSEGGEDVLEGVEVNPERPTKKQSTEHMPSYEDESGPKPEALNKKAVAIVNRVRDKLTGSDFTSNNNLDVPTQVDLLIKQATSHENLCQCYIGWCPFW
ncbi:serine/threonine-protein kinase mTOR [Pocillopora verrucosa]|uniref:serine/threonine-protein kinase mTOR-like n=1 Tax=Pocillopora damicornis TaxID=46731 RepID=UPI000F550AA1|nr:serine/threonine-protein kinase mTOR-like [Pocillopora damicornis]XP_058957469.1 serine/threonine-protein kinase mTOR-like [Pocillopora verrucosa]